MTDETSIRVERRARERGHPILRWYYRLKYRPFRRERRPHEGRRGLVALQIDALAYADLRRALELGYCPTLARLLNEQRYTLRRWFCGLPSATPYCQAGFFYGDNRGIPAFRFYVKGDRRVVTCNAPAGVQYVRDQRSGVGALAGGSSYVNLLDGDAQHVAFTVATRERTSVYTRLGGTRMALLILLHPARLVRMGLQSVWEWLREEWERLAGELAGRATHAEGVFPIVRILTNVVVRELQTMAILLDVYLGVPIIYSTFMQYDELAHHFGPSSRQALVDLRRTDARVREIERMIRSYAGRAYDLVILSDHGMTPAASYRVRFGETLGRTVQRAVDAWAERAAMATTDTHESFALDSEYADVGARVLDTFAAVASPGRPQGRRSRALRRVGAWIRRHYGLREIIFPEKLFVDGRHDIVVTYSSCLALVYFADDARRLEASDIDSDARRRAVYETLLNHAGVGLLLTRAGSTVRADGRGGRASIVVGDAGPEVADVYGRNPLAPYVDAPHVLAAIHELVHQEHTGDIVVFGAYDGYEIVSFDDQVGAHGSAGGDQTYPFLLAPEHLALDAAALVNARDLHGALLARYATPATSAPS